MASQWFNYTGSDPANPNHYSLSTTTPACIGDTEQLCAIQAENDGNNHPDIDLNIALEMVQALQSQANTTNVKLKER